MLKEDLKQLGLREKEAELYLALLEVGEANIQDLAEKAGIKRTSVYHLLEYLKEKGFVGVTTKKKRKLYFAQDPRKLESDLDERRSIVQRVVPELLSMANFIDKKPKIRYFDGLAGVKEILNDMLQYKEREILSWWTEKYRDIFGEDYFKSYFNPKRIEKKISYRVIAPNTPHYFELKSEDEKNLRKIKLKDFEESGIEIDINAYGGNKIAIVSYGEKMGLIIESTKIHNTLKTIFESEWKTIPDKNNNYRDE